MPETLSLSALSSTMLTQGIRFLYEQAGELLRRHRERRDRDDSTSATETPDIVATPRLLPQPDLGAVGELEAELRNLRSDLQEYAAGVDSVDPNDLWLIARVDTLRQALEVVYDTSLVFAGEKSSRRAIKGKVTVKDIAGYVAAVRAESAVESNVYGSVKAENVLEGGEVVAVDVRATRRRTS
jgi:hypothetical protein